MVSTINPQDTHPQMNLPEEATPWGRSIQERQVAIERALLALKGSQAGAGRAFDAVTGTLSEQIQSVVKTASFQQETYGGLSVATSYTEVLSVDVPVPEGYSTADFVISASAFARNDGGVRVPLYGLISVNGVAGISSLSGTTDNGDFAGVAFGDCRSVTGVGGTTVTVTVALKTDTAPWSFSASSRAKASILAIYHN